MTEINKYVALKEKLQGVCDENNLVYGIQNTRYPFRMTIRPASGMDAQLDMLESLGESPDTGYISADAVLVFAYRDGDLTFKISETWTISENLLNKLKNIFKKMCTFWMMYFFRETSSRGLVPTLREASGGPAAEPEEGDETEEEGHEFEELLDDDDADEADDDRPGSGLYDEN